VSLKIPAGVGRPALRTLLVLFGASVALTVSNPTLAMEVDLPHENAVPGGVKILHLDSEGPSLPYVDADGHRALVLPDDSKWVAVIGIPLSAPLGMRQVTVRGTNGRQVIEFSVGNKQYASQSLKVAPRQVNLSAADLARVNEEKIRIDHALSHWTEPPPQSLRLPQPVPGPSSSSFGSRRIFNGESRNPHSGMDIAAPTGTPVRTPIAGTVVDTGEYFPTAWIDPLYTYCLAGLIYLFGSAHAIAIRVTVGRPQGSSGRTWLLGAGERSLLRPLGDPSL